ncbi:sacsin N-terminal ATP-binding-like domain-containing protein [Pseudonocardia broussonetiae]|uniref:ATP-binding protein n=1 Tax=Pseudonocardia broussonetiae TaxID=2736640 RepID=A0A6M6JIJ8_9PSEU|nr:ATP-binding protein [Pseudonocardia broussonetiae]QJY46259.1 ATP-binding protein [Pseudonocardia broussonetiae]
MTAPSGADPFGTAALRAAVLDAWASSPTRFREDANVEEDLRLGGYADAWFVELAQNAADAARAAGGPGRIAVSVVDGELRVANTGAPLDAAGVAALASLRASAKRDADAVGRFGVGFAAVLAVTDAPQVVSTTGGVAFSAARTADAVAGLPGAAAELARRDEPPVLRLVWPVDGAPDTGFDTEVRMPLRPGLDPAALLARARADAPDLLLALPDLQEIAVGGEVLRRSSDGPDTVVAGRRWRLARRSGRLAAAADEAVEQRGRLDWSATWALPLDGALGEDEVLHAPTATGERLGLPARLIATVPMEPDRRRARTGPGADAVLAGAVDAYLDLVRATPPAERAALVPAPGFPRSPLDGRLRELVVDALRTAAWLPGADGSELVPARARWLDLPGSEELVALLGFADLAAAPPPAALEVERLSPAGLVERLGGVERPPSWWRGLYAALEPLAGAVPGLADDLRALPVPLADGRVAHGPPTVLLPAGADLSASLFSVSLPGLHLAHPDAVHPLLVRLGAREADARALLEHPALLAAVEGSLDDADAGLDVRPLAEAVLALVERVGSAPDGYGALALPADDGLPARADELMLPDAALAPLLGDDPPLGVVDAPWADRAALVAVGVVDGFAVVVDEEPTGPDHDLDDQERWWDAQPEPPRRVVAVRDLDLVADDAWPAALALLGSVRETREALREGYTPWWLARHVRLGGRRADHWRLPSATGIAALYDPCAATVAPATIATHDLEPCADTSAPALVSTHGSEEVWRAVGVRADLTVTDARGAADLLDRLADPARHPDVALVADAHIALTDAVTAGRVDPADLDAPERVRALDGTVVSVDVAVVLDAPWPASVLPAGELVAGGDPVVLADLLDLPLATDVVGGTVEGAGTAVPWADVAEVVVACHTLGVAVPPGSVVRHDELWVQVTRPVTGRFRVPVWPDGVGGWHAEDPLRALLALLAG